MKKNPAAKARRLGELKLATSGLTLADAALLRIDCLEPGQTAKLHKTFKPLCSLKINYLDHLGRPLSDWPGSRPFYRVRYLEKPDDFDGMTGKKPPRYAQEPDTAPVAYFPANQRWDGLAADPAQPLILTEGELKAAKACKEGFPAVGLGGVWCWRSHGAGLTWLPSLEAVCWRRRHAYVCYDSDYRANPDVCRALQELAEELHRRGAVVHVVSLPELPGLEKTGLDDFLTGFGPSADDAFRRLLRDADPIGLSAALWELNDKYVYVQDPGLIVDRATRAKINPSAFKEHLEAPLVYQERQLKLDGTTCLRAASAAAGWLKWPLRTEANRITYQPGQPQFVVAQRTMFNIWPGWGVDPAKGDVEPFLRLVGHLFDGADEKTREWFLRWCAYPLQFPGVKLFTSVIVHGIRHGTGKSLLGYTLGRIYGKNFTEISQVDLHNAFNEWAEGKQFVMGDDVTGSNKRADADYLKKLITQREIRVNGKYVPTYVVPDCINYFFTANHPDSFFLEDDDRRFFIHEVQPGPLGEEFYADYDLWLDTGGSAAVFDHLLRLDLGDFNPAAPARRTMAKERMIVNMQSDLAGWVRQLVANPDYYLRAGEVRIECDLFTSRDLLQLYDPSGRTGTTANGLGRELARAGVAQLNGGRPIRTADGGLGRYYAVRDRERWAGASAAEAAEHVNGWNARQTVHRKKF